MKHTFQRLLTVAGAALVAAACSHTSAGSYQPAISTARLSDVPPAQLGDVQAAQATLDQAKAAKMQASRDVQDVGSQLDVAKSQLKVAKSELKSQKAQAKASTEPVQPGAEQRAAEPARPAEPGAYPSTSDLYAAQLKQSAAKQRVDYLEKLKDYAKDREDVAGKLVGFDQAKVDQAVFQALHETRPEEARSMKHQAGWYAAQVARRQSDVADARAKMDQDRGEAMRRFDAWQSSFQKLRPADQTAPAPAPATLAPL